MKMIPVFQMKYSFWMHHKYCTSFVSQYCSNDHDVKKHDEEENIEALHRKMVAMPYPPIKSSPYELINSLNTKENSMGIILVLLIKRMKYVFQLFIILNLCLCLYLTSAYYVLFSL